MDFLTRVIWYNLYMMKKWRDKIKIHKDVSLDISPILDSWPKEEKKITARIFTDKYGQDHIQMRVNCGLIQMYLDGRPDGVTVNGCQTFLDYIEQLAIKDGSLAEYEDIHETDVWEELDRETMQFYYRRIALLAAGRDAQKEQNTELAKKCFRRAARDAEYTLRAMEFIQEYSDDEDYIEIHQRAKSFVIWHKVVANAQQKILDENVYDAIEIVKEGKREITDFYKQRGLLKWLKYDPSINELEEFEKHLRKKYNVKLTLKEQLEDAIEKEDYKKASELRNKLNNLN